MAIGKRIHFFRIMRGMTPKYIGMLVGFPNGMQICVWLNMKQAHTNLKQSLPLSVSVKYLDQRTKATQISQFDLTLEKDSNWKIVK